jgi:hypothetical protein
MDAADTIAAVEEATATERSRLGSDKVLIALTDATLEPDAVWGALSTREAGIADTLGGWNEDDGTIRAAVARAAPAAADRRDRLDATPGEADALSARRGVETVTAVGRGPPRPGRGPPHRPRHPGPPPPRLAPPGCIGPRSRPPQLTGSGAIGTIRGPLGSEALTVR